MATSFELGKRVSIEDALSSIRPLRGTIKRVTLDGEYIDVEHDSGGHIIRHFSKLKVVDDT